MTPITRRTFLASTAAASAAFMGPKVLRAQPHAVIQASYPTSKFDGPMGEAATLYESKHGIRIDFRRPVPGSHGEHLKQTLRWSITNNLPDVSFQGNHHVRHLVRSNLAQPLDTLASNDPDWAGVQPTGAAAQIGRINDQLFGIPFQISVPILMINEQLAVEAGADPKALPQDWPGLLALARKISSLDHRPIGGFFDFGAAWTFQALITAQGAQMATPDEREIAFNGAAGLAALEIVRGFGEAGMVDMTQTQAMQAFGAGTIGVFATSNNELANLERIAAGRFRIATMPWPMPSADGRLPAGGRTGVVFATDPERQRLGWDFIRFMASPEVQAIVVKATGAVPVDPAAMHKAGLLDAFYAEHANHQAGMARADRLTGWYSYPGENSAKIMDLMVDYVRSVATLQVSPEAALRTIANDVEKLLAKP